MYKSACVCFDLPSTVKSSVSRVHLSAKDLSSVLYKPLTTAFCLVIEYYYIFVCVCVCLCVAGSVDITKAICVCVALVIYRILAR